MCAACKAKQDITTMTAVALLLSGIDFQNIRRIVGMSVRTPTELLEAVQFDEEGNASIDLTQLLSDEDEGDLSAKTLIRFANVFEVMNGYLQEISDEFGGIPVLHDVTHDDHMPLVFSEAMEDIFARLDEIGGDGDE